MASGTYVQYGCGHSAPPEWLNFDASPTLRWERVPIVGRTYTKNSARFPKNVCYGDIVNGLPVAPDSCDGIFASHVLEHLALDDAQVALKNTLQMLRPRGIFRLVVPDLAVIARRYLEEHEAEDATACHRMLQRAHLGTEKNKKGVFGLLDYLRTSKHKWMWDYAGMERSLLDQGFTAVRRCEYGDCEDKMFALVEDKGRFEDAVAIEARKSAS
jgi:predicted SAM-dependent methyltransferase